MKRYNATDLLALTMDELWALPEERHIIVFDDGEVETHTRATIASVYLWEPLRGLTAPLKRSFHLGNERLTSRRMLSIINEVIWSIHDHNGDDVDVEVLAKRAFETINLFYNDMTVKLSGHVATLSLFDALEVANHPKIKEANEKLEPNEYSIEEVCYKQISGVLMDPNELRGNPIAEAVKSGTLSMDQTLQCFGPRGYITDINSDIFREPITTGYLAGIDDLYGSMIESRMGTKSLAYNKELLRDTEYFNRKSQLISQYVQNLHYGDCKSTYLINFPVMESLKKQLVGKYYLDPETQELKLFTGDEKHLVGTKIKIRSVLSCIHPDPAGVCSTCYGKLSYSIPRGTNIGHVSAVSIGDKITSSVLATKHLDSTSKVEKFIIHETEGKYLRYGKEDEALYLKRTLRGKKIKIVVFRDEARSLADVLMVDSLDGYPEANATQLTQMRITIDNGPEGTTSDVLRVSLYNRKSSFSKELLRHIRKKQWQYDTDGNVVVDLEGFNINDPLLTLPYKHVNMHEVMGRIQSFLHSGSAGTVRRLGDGTGRRNTRNRNTYLKSYKDPVEGLVVFFTMLNEKLNVNLVHCEVLVYAMMARSIPERDFRLPKPGIHGMFETYNNLMQNRSLAGVMAFEGQDRALTNPRTFIYTNRNSHPYDFIVKGGRMK